MRARAAGCEPSNVGPGCARLTRYRRGPAGHCRRPCVALAGEVLGMVGQAIGVVAGVLCSRKLAITLPQPGHDATRAQAGGRAHA
jgi:hypothetical protein